MYINNMLHCLDDSGNIPKEMPAEARKLSSFLTLIIDETTQPLSGKHSEGLRCFVKGCHGTISSHISHEGTIDWKCSVCENEGKISDWQGTKWDNRI